jgi:broad specificity phosphatase PhoE
MSERGDAVMAEGEARPRVLWLLRHGESVGNLAAARAAAEQLEEIAIPTREIEVPLSPLGERQAHAVGRQFAALPAGERPTAIVTSPYARARRTAALVREAGGLTAPVLEDERVRERELGILNRLTTRGVRRRHPDQHILQEQYGRFYYRPPGGESWCDVALRLRSFLDALRWEYAGERVLVACHSVVVLLFRYLLEGMTGEEVVALNRTVTIANCALTVYRADPDGRLVLTLFNHVAPLEAAGEPVTEEPHAGEVARTPA